MTIIRTLASTLVLVAAACGAVPGAGGGGLNSNACDLASSEGGRKIKAFLEATEKLDQRAAELENNTKRVCGLMAQELGISPAGDTKAVCSAVATAIRENLKVGLQAGASVTAEYKPAECAVTAEAGASAVAGCEGEASASSSSGSGASGGCAAAAEVHAGIAAECTPPEFDLAIDAGLVVDASKIERVQAALQHMPELLTIAAKAKRLGAAALIWARSAKDLAASAPSIAAEFPGRAGLCVSQQLSAAANVNVEVRVEVSVSASAEVGGAAGAGT